MKRFSGLIAGTALAALLSGCYATVGYEVPAPPPPQVEVIGIAPFYGAIWVPGEWRWHRRSRHHYWHRGYWRHSDGHERR